MKFKDVSVEYFKYLKIKLKNSTYQVNTRKILLYIINLNKNKNIYEFNSKDFINWKIKIESFHFSYNYKNSLYYLFKEFLDFCMMFYDLKENVAIKIGNFRNDEISKNGHIWSYEVFKKFIKTVEDKVYNFLFKFFYFTGVRKGEALAITFKDVDFENNKITINKTITRYLDDKGNKIITSPKTKSSVRTICIDNLLTKELFELKEYYTKKYGYFSEDFYVFGGIRPISFTTLERKKNEYCKLAGVIQIKIHEFRHSHACLLFKNKIDIEDISYRLGHSSISMTMDTYLKYLPKDEKRVINTLNNLRLT